MHFRMMAFAAVAMIAAPVLAQTTDAAAAKPAKPAKPKKICRREAVTGSIVGVKAVCHTQEEWAQINADNARNTDDALRTRASQANSR